MDTGIQVNHSWFKPGQVTHGFDFEEAIAAKSGSGGSSSVVTPGDKNGHGTQIAGRKELENVSCASVCCVAV